MQSFGVGDCLGVNISLRSTTIQERLLVIGWLSEACQWRGSATDWPTFKSMRLSLIMWLSEVYLLK